MFVLVDVDQFEQLLFAYLAFRAYCKTLRVVLQHVRVLEHLLASGTKHFEHHQNLFDPEMDVFWFEFAIAVFLGAGPDH